MYDCGWRIVDCIFGWKTEDGGLDRGWKLEDGGWRMEDGWSTLKVLQPPIH